MPGCALLALQMTGVVRLFYFYSSLLNIADEAHAHRKRREQVRAVLKPSALHARAL